MAAGLVVPGELSIIGLGDSECARLQRPRLTTVRFSPYNAGADAVLSLLAMMRGALEPRTATSVKLIVRGSTAPPPVGVGEPYVSRET